MEKNDLKDWMGVSESVSNAFAGAVRTNCNFLMLEPARLNCVLDEGLLIRGKLYFHQLQVRRTTTRVKSLGHDATLSSALNRLAIPGISTRAFRSCY